MEVCITWSSLLVFNFSPLLALLHRWDNETAQVSKKTFTLRKVRKEKSFAHGIDFLGHLLVRHGWVEVASEKIFDAAIYGHLGF